MKIIPLGCGSAGSRKEPQTNFLIQQNGKNMLVDCGSCIRYPLEERGIQNIDVDAIYISHQHADHLGGIEDFAFGTYFNPTTRRSIKLFGNKHLLNDSWNHSWSGGLRCIQGDVIVDLDSYFDVRRIDDNGCFLWEGIQFELVQSIHVMNKFSLVPSYGLMIHIPESTKKVYLTTDQQFAPNQIRDFWKIADLIVQDCETAKFMSGVHAHVNELKSIPEDIKSKMLLAHYGDNWVVDIDSADIEIKKAGFKGLCRKGIDILGEN